MPVLTSYNQFSGLHWETGVLHNLLAYAGQPISEAMLLGIAGGITAGYFIFEYQGSDPYLHFLTYHLYNGEPTVLYDRLGIKKMFKRTDDADKAVQNLVTVLEAGQPAVVWADMYALPYNAIPHDDQNYAVMPLIVYGHDDMIHIADRARVPLTATPEELARARGRAASVKHALMTIGAPDMSRLPTAIEEGIRECIQNFIGEPPKAPMKGRFGLDAFTRWANMLVDSKDKNAWPKKFAPGARFYSGLTSLVQFTELYFTGGRGARGVYADFLDEAANVLGKPALRQVADQYRLAADLWAELPRVALADHVVPFKETRDLMVRRYDLFLSQGAASLVERRQISERLEVIKAQVAADFPLTESESAALRESLRAHVLKIHDTEKEAVTALNEVMT